MMRNVELLQQTMQHIKDHPEEHRQDMWICGTAACFAGRAALLQGMRYEQIDDLDMWQAGAALLGLSKEEARTLFDVDNTRPMLELMVKDLVNGSDLRPTEDYWRES